MRQTIFALFIFCLFSSLLCSQNDWSSQLKSIEAITNDSIALNSLQALVQKNKSNLKAQLHINVKIIMRANQLQKYSLATSIGNESAVLANKNNLDSLEATFHKYIGVTNYYMDRKRAAIPYFEKALTIAKKNNYWELEASCHNNIGGALADIQEYALAETHLLRSIAIMKDHEQENNTTTLRTFRVLARVYSEDNNPDKAEALYLTLIEKGKANKDTAFVCDNLVFYSEILSKRGEFEKALAMSKEALTFRRKQKSIHDLHGALEIHSLNLINVGRLKEAYELLAESKLLLRNIFKKDLEKEISEVEVKYKTAQLQKEKELAELKTKKQRQIYIFSFLGVFVLAVSGFYVWAQRKKAKHFTELSEIEKSRFKDVIEAEEKERSRIAQELHDGLGQLLSTARLNVAGLEDSVSSEDKAGVERSLKIIDEACVEVRSISHNMMPSALIRLGLIPAIHEVVNNVNAVKSIKIDFICNIEASLGKSLDITIYRVVQEILNNMIKHSKADHIKMSIKKEGNDLKISMQDNGIGFNTEELKKSKGIGWKNIFSRVTMLDGNIKLESELQKGTSVYINLRLKMDKELKIVIADDHQMFIDGIKALLKKETKLNFVHEANNAEDALTYIRKNEVDMLITDISMPGLSGTELTKKIKQEFPQIKVLVITMFSDPAIINEILQSEAEGYILKNTGKQELLSAIKKIMDHGTFYSNEVMNLMLKHNRKKVIQTTDKEDLTTRELEILKLVCEELTTADIAEKLFISPRTVDTHRKNILEKTQSKTIVGLIKYAFENNIIG